MEAELTIVCSRYLIPWRYEEDTWENRSSKSSAECFSSIEIQLPSLQPETEADMRIIPHLYWALNFEYDSFVVLTNDADVLVLLLQYCVIFLRMKLKNPYIKIGTGTSTRYLPVNQLADILVEKQYRNLLKVHIATGCDWLSKLGTKSNVLHKVDLLDSFEESDMIENDLINATEAYFTSVLKGKDVSFKTFDEYRYHQHVTCNTTIQSLVSMLYCIRNGHIMCLFCLIRPLSSWLDEHFVSMDPGNYS